MFSYLYEIVGASVGEEIHPFLWVKCGSGEVLDEVVVDMVWAVGCEVVLVCFFWGVGTEVFIPPVPFCVAFVFPYVSPARNGVDALVNVTLSSSGLRMAKGKVALQHRLGMDLPNV
jgi:hypothetical protein